jgi:hypothetical protein
MGRHRKKQVENAAVSKKLIDRSRKIKKQLKELAHDLWLNDRIIQLGLVASGMQLTFAFAYSHGAWYAVAWSWFSALAKASFIEICIWSINRAIAWAGVMQIKKGVAILWVILSVVFFISTRANLQYEYTQKIHAHNLSEKVINSDSVDYYLKADEIFDSWLRGGLIPILVLGMIAARRLLGTAGESFEREEMQRVKVALRGAEYRANKKQIENEVGGDV